ncbi:hypothetical protein BDM02DRAFT_3188971 [Thelephora ganbajun]|uniref:Uncharacterized protein n=1 Tax=Thelephora ganbajun TaxID=370292 RepID=A0ACB6Z9P2_THEGA|nr:hypothetical protein BDM02DRAFT_3188971 [Thelephora ganbajun]
MVVVLKAQRGSTYALLAGGFPITAGKVDAVVPSQYPDRGVCVIALIGSFRNISPTFAITGESPNPSAVDSSTVSRPVI